MAKYIFVTGGVVSSLGKGITAASLGMLLKCWGLNIRLQKFDPYLNVDPGTMNPYQHGEVYVTEDGTETDLDLGHYERFTGDYTSRDSNYTSGQLYNSVLSKERRGDYLGQTIQLIPHVTDEIKDSIRRLATPEVDVVISEIGGTVGDIEGLPFLEALRQMSLDEGRDNVMYIHVSLVPYIRAAQEIKTKPTQHSVGRLREIGITPDAIICRTEKPLTRAIKEKISLFCNVDVHAVIEEPDVRDTIYEVPFIFMKEELDRIIIDRLKLQDAYKSIYEAIDHGGIAHNCKVNIVRVLAENVQKNGPDEYLKDIDAILVPGGFGSRGIEGKIETIQYAREHKIPFLGICLGLQCAAIEFARNVCKIDKADSTEINPETEHPVICLLEEQKGITEKGASMRLGAYPCKLAPGTLAREAYGKDIVQERHRHRYEFNNAYRDALEKNGMVFSGIYPEQELVEIMELKDHPWFVGCQFHPEFKSYPTAPHPLFRDFVGAGLNMKRKK
jgi:CTP synthase